MSNTSKTPRTFRHKRRIGVGLMVGSAVTAASLFGATTAANAAETPSQPIGAVDSVVPGVGTLQVSGWAIEPDTTNPIDVQVFVDGVYSQTVHATAERDDVAAAYPGYGAMHGYSAVLTGLSSTAHTINVYGINASGVQSDNVLLGSQSVAPASTTSFGAVDSVAGTGASSVRVQGWAIDPKTASPITVAVYVDGLFAMNATADGSRADVGAVYPTAGANHGYDVTVPVATGGNHTVDVYAIDSTANGDNPLLARNTINVDMTSFGAVDLVSQAGGSSVRVAGWAIDPKSSAPETVAIYVDGVLSEDVTASAARPDVAAVYPADGADHGYDVTVPVATGGSHTVDVYAIDTTGDGDNPLLARDTVNVNTTAFGVVDLVGQTTGDSVHVVGWAIDPKTDAPIMVAVYVDGAPMGSFTAGTDRPDVGAAYPTAGENHGFDLTVPAPTLGSHTIDVYAIDSTGNGNNPLLASTTTVITSSVL